MFEVKDSVRVDAPLDRCFLLSTSIALVQQTLGLKPVEGKTSGLIVADDRLVWRGWKFGLPAMHETLITGYERPVFFEDTMGRGRFKFFQHQHHFAGALSETGGPTLMSDVVRFSLPFGPLGRLVGRFILVPHVRNLVQRRFQLLKRIAESEDWHRYLDPSPAASISSAVRSLT